MDESARRELALILEPLREVLTSFADGRATADQLEDDFFPIFQTLAGRPSPQVFDAMERYFGSVDDYVGDPELRDAAAGDLGPEELRERTIALVELAGWR